MADQPTKTPLPASPAWRMDRIAPFRVMEILERAKTMEAAGREIIHMEVGEPDFPAPPRVIAAAKSALDLGYTHYTAAAGIPELRRAIAVYYQDRLGITIDPRRILLTPGSSGALQLVLAVLTNPGDEVLLTDPGYPCNRHMVSLFGGIPRPIELFADQQFRIDAADVVSRIGPSTRALMLASPANPTGRSTPLDTVADLYRETSAQPDFHLIVDEIYQGLEYGVVPGTALKLGEDRLFVINSFSKFFSMTGFRLGWVVAPSDFVEPLERLAQNLFLSAPTVAQYAALAALTPDTLELLESRRIELEARRNLLHTGLDSLGFDVGERPDGAFYIYAGLGALADDSERFASDLLDHAGVAITPGNDFGSYRAKAHVRFAYTTGQEKLAIGLEKIEMFLRMRGARRGFVSGR